MRFALSTHLFHGEPLTRAHLETIKAARFEDVEIFATRTHFNYADDREVGRLGEWLSQLGMTAASVHAPICAAFVNGQWGRAFSNASGNAAARQETVEETSLAIRAGGRLGCEFAVLHLGLPRGQPVSPDDNDRRAVRRSLEQIAETAVQSNVQLALELIPNDLSTADSLLEWLDSDLELGPAGACLDAGHAHLMGGAPEAIEALAGHVITTHIHDNRGKSDDHLVPFAGNVDWPAVLASLRKVGYGGRLVFEVANTGDALDVLERTIGARAQLQAILDDLARPFEFEGGPQRP